MSIQVSLVYENEYGVRGSLCYGFPLKSQGEFALQVGYADFSGRCPPRTLSEAREQVSAGHGHELAQHLTLAVHRALPAHLLEIASVGNPEEEA